MTKCAARWHAACPVATGVMAATLTAAAAPALALMWGRCAAPDRCLGVPPLPLPPLPCWCGPQS